MTVSGRRLSRRQRRVLATALLAAAFVAGSGLVLLLRPGAPPHRPGEEVEGLTSTLQRDLPSDVPDVAYEDVTQAAGIRFRHFGGRRSSQLPEDMGSGAAWGDYDNDGWPDLFVVNVVGPLDLPDEAVEGSPFRAHLYHNEGNGTFTEVAEAAGVAHRGRGMGAAWGDYDNDGWPDLIVTAYGENTLYRNRGDGSFEDVTDPAGIGGVPGFWTGAAWGDYDRDGDLDLYITGYVRYDPETVPAGSALQYDVEVPAALNPSAFVPERNLLYRNEGDGSFREVSAQAGVEGREGRGLAAAWSDLDEDGWPDLYVANDVSDNALYRNRGDGTFEDVSHRALVADYRGAMGLAVGDWNGDGDTDLFITHWIAQENALYDNKLRRRFVSLAASPTNALQFMDEADRWGLGQVALDFVGWATSFFDYDNDGRPDLFVVNGSTFQRRERPELLVPMRDQLFWNGGADRGFYDVSGVAGAYFASQHVGRGGAVADYDRDGDLDLFIVNHGEEAVLLRNEGGNRGHWLELRLKGTRSNRSAIGARLRLLSAGLVQVREVGAQASYLSGNSRVVHFGLGQASTVDSVEIQWPSGVRQVLRGLPADRILTVREGEGFEEGRPEAARPPGPGGERAEVLRFWELYRRATDLRIRGEREAAVRAYEDALRLDPDHENTLYYLGNLYFEEGRFAQAEALWRHLLGVNPSNGRAHMRLGVLYSCFEDEDGPAVDPEAAARELRRALEINRAQMGPLFRLTLVELLRDSLDAAREHLRAIQGTDPGNPVALYLKGFLFWRRGESEEAVRLFRAAVQASKEAAPGGASLEGETRAGARPLRASEARCDYPAEMERILVEGGAGAHPVRSADSSYRRLNALLESARRGAAPSARGRR